MSAAFYVPEGGDFVSTELTRGPRWVGLDAITIPQPNGIGLADTALYDERGPLGRAIQTLLVRSR